MSELKRAFLGLVILLGGSTVAMAQTPKRILPPDAKPGDRLTVTTTNGARFSGKLVDDAAGVLVLESERHERSVIHTDILEVSRYRNRFLFGPLIGLGAGLALGLPLKSRFDNEGGNGDALLGVTVGLGLLMGTTIDLANGSHLTLYRRTGTLETKLELQPRGNGRMISATLSW